MIRNLFGIVREIEDNLVIIDVNNIGYEVYCPHINKLSLNQSIMLYTYLQITQDNWNLYGFISKFDLDVFKQLIKVKGIGPKIALSILTKIESKTLIEAIYNQDLEYLKKIPGIGNKSASQIMLDLKGKLVISDDLVVKKNNNVWPDYINDTLLALNSLGYRQNECYNIVDILLNSKIENVSELVKIALKHLK